MQSSTAIAIRALVMLVCLICIPMFAIFGKDVPAVLKGIVEGRGLVLGPAPGSPANAAGATPLPSPNNPFGEPAPYRAASDAMSASAANKNAPSNPPNPFPGPNSGSPPAFSAAPAANATLAQAGPYRGDIAATPIPTAVPANSAATPADWRVPPAAATVPPAEFQTPPGASPLNNSQFAIRDSFPTNSNPPLQNLTQQLPQETAAPAIYAGAGFPPAGRMASAKPDVATTVRTEERFRTAETRLRELGASHYVLESWGTDNSQYRFACEMSVGVGGMNRRFEAHETDPWRAMDSVLRQVEDWRSAPRQ